MLFRRKLPRSSFVLLSASLVCAIAAAGVMHAYARRLDEIRPDGGPPIRVVTVRHDVARGSVLTQDALEFRTMPSNFVSPGALHDPAGVLGRVASTDLAAGEVVTRLRVAGAGSGPTASIVPLGLRAVQVPVAATVGVAPGDLVDVLATFGGGGAHTEVTGEALEVLRVVRGAGGAAGAPTSGSFGLVLLVTPDVAERLAFASTFATLSVAVRGPEEPASAAPTFGS